MADRQSLARQPLQKIGREGLAIDPSTGPRASRRASLCFIAGGEDGEKAVLDEGIAKNAEPAIAVIFELCGELAGTGERAALMDPPWNCRGTIPGREGL